jgi:hypothetical protein
MEVTFSGLHISMLISTATCFVLGHYATSRKVAGSSPDEVGFFQFTYSFQTHFDTGVDSASNRVPGIFFVGKGRPVRKPGNLTTICEPRV